MCSVPDTATGSSRRSGTRDASGPTSRVIWNATGAAIRIGQEELAAGQDAARDAWDDHRSPLSPCPVCTFVVAFVRRSAAADFPTSSDSLKRPVAPRRTNRLPVLVLMSSRFAAFVRPRRCALLRHFLCGELNMAAGRYRSRE